jgi:hypothetical protein
LPGSVLVVNKWRSWHKSIIDLGPWNLMGQNNKKNVQCEPY